MDIDADLHTTHRPGAHMVVTLVSAWAQIKTNVSLDQFIFIQKSEKKRSYCDRPFPNPLPNPALPSSEKFN